MDINKLLHNAAQGANTEIVDLVLSLDAIYSLPLVDNLSLKPSSIASGAYGAARGGHIALFDKLRKLSIVDLNMSLYNAAKFGNVDMIEHIIDLGATNIDSVPNILLEHGHIETADYFIAKGIGYYTKGRSITHIAETGNLDKVKLFITHRKFYLNQALTAAAEKGYIDIVKYLVSEGADNFNSAAEAAAHGGHLVLVNYFLELGVKIYNKMMVAAAVSGNMVIINLMLELGATDYNSTLVCAAMHNQGKVIDLMLTLGANNINYALLAAAEYGYKHIAKQMIELGATGIEDAIKIIVNPYGKEEYSTMQIAKYTHINADVVDYLSTLL